MKKYHIPLIDKSFYIYEGKEDWYKFYNILKSEKVDIDIDGIDKNTGYCFLCYVWVFDLNDKRTLIHELSHLIDNAMETIGSTCSELRAYITEYIYCDCLKIFKNKDRGNLEELIYIALKTKNPCITISKGKELLGFRYADDMRKWFADFDNKYKGGAK